MLPTVNHGLEELSEDYYFFCAAFESIRCLMVADFSRVPIDTLLSSTLPNSDPRIRLPSDWTPEQAIPSVPNPLPDEAPLDPSFLKWLDLHIGTSTSVGKWFTAEN